MVCLLSQPFNLFTVLYSASSGWWKITDFGLTLSATSRHLQTTTGRRGRACYMAPELIRDTAFGFNKKVDIWSLGCILFELCIGQKAFKNDFAVFQFASSEKQFLCEFPGWFKPDFAKRFRILIQKMLDPEHENRPSINALCEDCKGLISGIICRDVNQLTHEMGKDKFFIQSENMLGTDVPTQEGFHSIRWEMGLPGFNSQARTAYVTRFMNIVEARKFLLGTAHPNTIWSIVCLAWTLVSAGLAQTAVDKFLEALEILKNSQENTISEFIRFGLGWAYLEDGKLRDSYSQFKLVLDRRLEQGTELTRHTLATQSALARNHLLWRPYDQTRRNLEAIADQQTVLLGEEHPDTLESISLLAVADLFQHDYSTTQQANKRSKKPTQFPQGYLELSILHY